MPLLIPALFRIKINNYAVQVKEVCTQNTIIVDWYFIADDCELVHYRFGLPGYGQVDTP